MVRDKVIGLRLGCSQRTGEGNIAGTWFFRGLSKIVGVAKEEGTQSWLVIETPCF